VGEGEDNKIHFEQDIYDLCFFLISQSL